ncbi:MAG: hypothetical protein AB7F43_13895 [Bacteriovoracia bacterium]
MRRPFYFAILTISFLVVSSALSASKEEIIKQVIELTKAADPTKRIGGYHGTSLEAIMELLKKGYLPAGKVTEQHLYLSVIDGQESPEESKLSTKIYAKNAALDTYLLRAIGAKKFSLEARNRAGQLIDYFPTKDHLSPHQLYEYNRARAFFTGFYHITEKKLDSILKKITETIHDQRQGVLLTVSDQVLEDFPVSHGDDVGLDVKVKVGKGLPLKYIVKIEPLGPYEKKFFEDLEKKAGNQSACVKLILKHSL